MDKILLGMVLMGSEKIQLLGELKEDLKKH